MSTWLPKRLQEAEANGDIPGDQGKKNIEKLHLREKGEYRNSGVRLTQGRMRRLEEAEFTGSLLEDGLHRLVDFHVLRWEGSYQTGTVNLRCDFIIVFTDKTNGARRCGAEGYCVVY
jgi:hypothetical protein